MRRFVATVLLFGLEVLPAQTILVTATGGLQVAYQPSYGGVVTQPMPVAGATALTLPGIGSAQVTVGTSSALRVTADSPPFGCYGCWSSASGNVRFTFAASTPLAGVLRLSVAPACLMASPPWVDVNDDTTWELVGIQATQSVDVPVVLGQRPIPVRVDALTVNFGGAVCSYPVTVQFVPQASALDVVGPACGPSLAASLTEAGTRTLTLAVGGMNGVLGALAIGGAPSPVGGCGPAGVPVCAVLLTPQPQGVAMPVPVPAGLTGLVTLQCAELSANGTLAFSNGVRALL